MLCCGTSIKATCHNYVDSGSDTLESNANTQNKNSREKKIFVKLTFHPTRD